MFGGMPCMAVPLICIRVLHVQPVGKHKRLGTGFFKGHALSFCKESSLTRSCETLTSSSRLTCLQTASCRSHNAKLCR